MTYENPNRQTIQFGSYDFGAGSAEAFVITPPQGKEGILWDYGIQAATEAFAASTITPKIAVGTTADPDAYGEEIVLTAVAIDTGESARSANGLDVVALDLVIVDKYLPRDTAIFLTVTSGTGNPTGQATPFIVIDWQW